MRRREFLLALSAAAAATLPHATLSLAADVTAPVDGAAGPASRPATRRSGPFASFYGMDTGLQGPDVPKPADKVRLLKELGYDGIGYSFRCVDELRKMLDLLDAAGVELTALYTNGPVDDKPVAPTLVKGLQLLKGRRTVVEMTLPGGRSGRGTSASDEGDAIAAGRLKAVADAVGTEPGIAGVQVSAYPHVGTYANKVAGATRVARLAGGERIGINLNLYHEGRGDLAKLRPTLKAALPFLKLVTINGHDGKCSTAPVPDDVYVLGLLRLLKEIGYAGPVGFQGRGIPGPSAELLGQTIKSWRTMTEALKSAGRPSTGTTAGPRATGRRRSSPRTPRASRRVATSSTSRRRSSRPMGGRSSLACRASGR